MIGNDLSICLLEHDVHIYVQSTRSYRPYYRERGKKFNTLVGTMFTSAIALENTLQSLSLPRYFRPYGMVGVW